MKQTVKSAELLLLVMKKPDNTAPEGEQWWRDYFAAVQGMQDEWYEVGREVEREKYERELAI